MDVGPSEVFDNLDFGFMMYVEMSNRDWAFTLDGLYMNLGAKGMTPVLGREVEVDMKQLSRHTIREYGGPDRTAMNGSVEEMIKRQNGILVAEIR